MIQNHQNGKRGASKSSVTLNLCSENSAMLRSHSAHALHPDLPATTLSCPWQGRKGHISLQETGWGEGVLGLPAVDYFSVHRLV